MTERTKLVIIIAFQTILIVFDYAIGFLGESTESDLPTFVLILSSWFIYIVFGFFTENAQKLFLYSTTIAVVDIIFVSSDMYFNPKDYEETLQFWDISTVFLLLFCFTFILITCLIFIGLGMILSHLFKVNSKKRADKF